MFSRNKGLTTVLLLTGFSIANITANLVLSAPNLFWGEPSVKTLDGIFEKTIFKEERKEMWLVWFYKHWCADCMNFASDLTSAFVDMSGWSDYVRLGVVNCDNPLNFGICKMYNITIVGESRVFQPYSNRGLDFTDDLYNIAKALKLYHNQQANISGIVNLKTFTDSGTDILWKSYPESVRYLVLVFQSEDASFGTQLALDMSKYPEVRVRLVDLNNTNLYQLAGIKTGTTGFVVQERKPSLWNKLIGGKPKPSTIYVEILESNADRRDINTGLRRVLIDRGVNIPEQLPTAPMTGSFFTFSISDDVVKKGIEREKNVSDSLKLKDLSTTIFSYDLQTTLYYIFTVELAQRNTISGEPFKALKDLVTVIFKYFPSTEKMEKFFGEFKERTLDDKESVTGTILNETFVELDRKYSPFLPKLNWLACRGVYRVFRGYPCGLWTLFHTLVASEDLKKRSSPDKKPEALNAVIGYVKHLFSCKNSGSYFDLSAPLNTTEQAVLWLWNVHNAKNIEVRGSNSQCPRNINNNFPTKEQCEDCYTNGVRNVSKVFTFLSNMYTNVTDVDPNIFNNFYKDLIPNHVSH